MNRLVGSIAFLSTLLSGLPAHAGASIDTAAPARAASVTETTDRFIVVLRDSRADPRPALAAIGGTFGERFEYLRGMSGGAHVVRLGRRVFQAEARQIARLLAADPRIALIEPDELMHPQLVPNDTMYGQQWNYYEPLGGINLPAAWDITTGSPNITVAVIDTGARPHVDLAGRFTAGYDFISDATASNDGDGRDGDASDPGDYGCNGSASTWHGTHVAGTIGAASNNGVGVTGINWVSKILPVRVLGRCGGYTSDIADGMRWAAGIAVAGAPVNPTPARVENLSLGGDGPCSSTFQSAVTDVVARGTVVVVAAGNSNADAANAQPASCNGVIAVAATMRNGGRASFSNYGSKVAIAAPGGGGGTGILSTLNSGSTTPGADSYAFYQGTSMASPHVAGVVSLMLSLDPSLTPAQVLQRLRTTARAFPSGTGADCTTALCGAGIVDAAASLAGLGAVEPTWSKIADEGQNFTVSGTRTVRYGSGTSWITLNVTNGGSCTNAFFGSDPLVGVFKQCEVSSTVPPPAATTWSFLANENETFTVSGTQTVRYGSGSSWITLSVTNGGTCSNAFFGNDPVFGAYKHCELLGAAAPAVQWSQIANENESFTVSGTQTVRYGSEPAWITRSVTTSGACTNAFFGTDPLVGVSKQCQLRTSAGTAAQAARR